MRHGTASWRWYITSDLRFWIAEGAKRLCTRDAAAAAAVGLCVTLLLLCTSPFLRIQQAGVTWSSDTAPDAYPPMSADFPSPPSSKICADHMSASDPCNCHAPLPSCHCSPFHGGTRLVPPPLRLHATHLHAAASPHPLTLKGVNWFGFEVGDQFPTTSFWEPAGGCHGKDISLIATRLRLLGFTAVRLPFTFTQLSQRLSSQAYQFRACTMPTADEFRRDLLPPELRGTPTPGSPLPPGTVPATPATPIPPMPPYRGWKCLAPGGATYTARSNFMVPGARGGTDAGELTVGDRFRWTVMHLVAQGLNVVLDYQPFKKDAAYSGLAGEGQTYGTPAALAAAWAGLLQSFIDQPGDVWNRYLKGRLIVDVMNEPDVLLCEWDRESAGSSLAGEPPCPPYRDLVNAVVNRVYEISPETILFVEGAGQRLDRCNVWGAGFRVAGTNGSSAESWFATVNKEAPVVLSTHQYCRTTNTADGWGCGEEGLLERFDQNVGLKSAGQGYAGKRWPFVFGEIGSGPDPYRAASNPTDRPALDNTDRDFRPSELPCMESLVKYITNGTRALRNGSATQHARPIGVFWWSWNWNSGDVNGMTDYYRDERDALRAGVNVKWYKVRWLQRAAGLRPWYVAAGEAAGADNPP